MLLSLLCCDDFDGRGLFLLCFRVAGAVAIAVAVVAAVVASVPVAVVAVLVVVVVVCVSVASFLLSLLLLIVWVSFSSREFVVVVRIVVVVDVLGW